MLKKNATFSATEVANNKKNNVPNSVPIKVRSFAKKMDTTSKCLVWVGRKQGYPFVSITVGRSETLSCFVYLFIFFLIKHRNDPTIPFLMHSHRSRLSSYLGKQF